MQMTQFNFLSHRISNLHNNTLVKTGKTNKIAFDMIIEILYYIMFTICTLILN